jgi:hypothetical protein
MIFYSMYLSIIKVQISNYVLKWVFTETTVALHYNIVFYLHTCTLFLKYRVKNGINSN